MTGDRQEVTSDGYHKFLHFLILDLHKSEVGPSNLPFFLAIFFFSKIKKKKISAGLSTPLLQG